MLSRVSFLLDGQVTSIDFSDDAHLRPTTTVLNYLRSLPTHRGVKEGCAEGDCGACTVVLGEVNDTGSVRYKSVDSCLLFLPALHCKQLITVENLKMSSGDLHPVQQAMVETNGSQCGYCTPGFIMSLFSLYKNYDHPAGTEIDDALTGNLCRCTGYRSIVEAAARACVRDGIDQFSRDEQRIVALLRSMPRESLRLRTPDQQYFRPVSLGEAVTLKHQHPQAIVMCGATDLALRVTKGHELLKEIIDLSAVEELQEITESDTSISVGAGVTLSDLMPKICKQFPALYNILGVFGSQQIRNLATLGGNLGTASPIGDTLPVLIAYGARVTLEGLNGKREVHIDEFFTGYRTTVRRSAELITAIQIPRAPQNAVVKSYKISKRKDLDISTVSSGFKLMLNTGRCIESIVLAFGGMAERTTRAVATERFLTGKSWVRSTIQEALQFIDIDFTPISDARSGAEMRSIAAKNLLVKFWSETTQENITYKSLV